MGIPKYYYRNSMVILKIYPGISKEIQRINHNISGSANGSEFNQNPRLQQDEGFDCVIRLMSSTLSGPCRPLFEGDRKWRTASPGQTRGEVTLDNLTQVWQAAKSS